MYDPNSDLQDTAPRVSKPRVAVIVPAYGVAHLLGEALASLQRQTMPDWECIVVDDGAPDDVAGAVAPFLADPRIRFLQTDNAGVATARNRAIAACSAPLITMLDGDDRLRADYLARMTAALEQDADARLVTCNARIFGAVPQERLCFEDKQGTLDGRHGSLNDVIDRSFGVYIGSTLRRSDFEAIGGFDPAMTHAEDFDLWVRLLLLGGHALYIDEVLGEYRVRGQSASASTIKMLRGNIRTFEKALAALVPNSREAATAQRMIAENQTALKFELAIDRIIAGDTTALADLKAARGPEQGRAWDIAFMAWKIMPAIAEPMLSRRRRAHARGAGASNKGPEQDKKPHDIPQPATRRHSGAELNRDQQVRHSPVPQVTVAITAYNAGKYIGAAIDSMLGQSFEDFELLVVDDQSSDDTRSVVIDRAERDPRVRLVTSPQKGRVPALNRILEESRGAWFSVFDADDIAKPDKLAKQMAFLASHPDHGVVGSNNGLIDTDGRPLPMPSFDRPLNHEDLTQDMELGIRLLHSTMIARTDLVRNVGGYRAPFRFAQDYDLLLRLAMVTRMANLPDRLVDYRVYSDQVSSKHPVAQTMAAIVVWLSHQARIEGEPDPVEHMISIPELGTLDEVFGKTGCDAFARKKIVERILYSPEALTGDGWDALIGHAGEAKPTRALWAAAARLLKHGRPVHAARLGARLLAA